MTLKHALITSMSLTLLLTACGELGALLGNGGSPQPSGQQPDTNLNQQPDQTPSSSAPASPASPGTLNPKLDVLLRAQIRKVPQTLGAVSIAVKAEEVLSVSLDGEVLAPGDYSIEAGSLIVKNRPIQSGQMKVFVQGVAEPITIPLDTSQAQNGEIELAADIRTDPKGNVLGYDAGYASESKLLDRTRTYVSQSKSQLTVFNPKLNVVQVYQAGKQATITRFQNGLPVFEANGGATLLTSFKSETVFRTKTPSPVVSVKPTTLNTTLAPTLKLAPFRQFTGTIEIMPSASAPSAVPTEVVCDRFPLQPDGSIRFGYEIQFCPVMGAYIPVVVPSVQGNAPDIQPIMFQRNEFEFRADGSVHLLTTINPLCLDSCDYAKTDVAILPAGAIVYPTPCDMEAFMAGVPTPPPPPSGLPTLPPPPAETPPPPPKPTFP